MVAFAEFLLCIIMILIILFLIGIMLFGLVALFRTIREELF